MSTVGIYEVTITNGGWNGDLALDETGDLALSVDTPQVPQATIERVTRMVMMTPNLKDQNGNVIGYADDIFHTDFGVGLRAYVDENFDQATFNALTAAIQKQLADPAMGIAQSPPPTVSINLVDTATATLEIAFYTSDGAYGVLPTITLLPSTVSLS